MAQWVLAATYYVDASRPDDSGDGRSWATAKKTIQAAVDLKREGDTVLVTNGVYDLGGRPGPDSSLTNRVVITNDIVVRSVHGPDATVIRGQGVLGDQAVRCVWISAGRMEGVTSSQGRTRTTGDILEDRSGGGVSASGGTLVRCTISGNQAHGDNGGVYGGRLRTCALIGNSAGGLSGGACGGALWNCFLWFNSAMWDGDGAAAATLDNCVRTGNSSELGDLAHWEARCTTAPSSTTMQRRAGVHGVENCTIAS